MSADHKWKSRVGKVFSTNPRVRDPEEEKHGRAMWFPRRNEEQRFSDALNHEGLHVCLDGPTGTGKSSMAISQLVDNRIPFATVLVTGDHMTWQEFCEQAIDPMPGREVSGSTEFTIGLDRGLPTTLLKLSRSKTSVRRRKAVKALAADWTEADLARELTEANAALLVDDVDRASDDIIKRLVALCRLLNHTHTSDHAKVVIVGTGTTYRRLFDEYYALTGRVRHISLGALPTPDDSWGFLVRGFEKLGIIHPGASKFHDERLQLSAVKERCYEAADCLLKSLNDLGFRLAMLARPVGRDGKRRSLTAADAQKVAAAIPVEAWQVNGREFSALVDLLVESEPAVDVVRYLFRNGVGRVYQLNQVVDELAQTGREVVEAQIEYLARGGDKAFLTRSGQQGEVFWITRPDVAHNLGVLLSDPERWPEAKRLHDRRGQLELPLPRPKLDSPSESDDSTGVGDSESGGAA